MLKVPSQEPPMAPPQMPPAPPMPQGPEEMPSDGVDGQPEDDGNENLTRLQSDAAKLAQKVSTANPQDALTAIKQFNSVAAKALNSDDVDSVVSGIEKAANGNEEGDDNGEQQEQEPQGGYGQPQQPPMPNESYRPLHRYSKLDEVLDSILNDENGNTNKVKKVDKKIRKSSPWRSNR